jgi:CheY-like chemotaxis protein
MFLTEAHGYQVSLHFTGKSALAHAVLEAPEAFVLDIGLPDMSGYDLARQLRMLPQTADAFMLALTGYGQDKDREHAEAAGFDHHLAKPADPALLAELLAKASALRKRLNKNSQ